MKLELWSLQFVYPFNILTSSVKTYVLFKNIHLFKIQTSNKRSKLLKFCLHISFLNIQESFKFLVSIKIIVQLFSVENL